MLQLLNDQQTKDSVNEGNHWVLCSSLKSLICSLYPKDGTEWGMHTTKREVDPWFYWQNLRGGEVVKETTHLIFVPRDVVSQNPHCECLQATQYIEEAITITVCLSIEIGSIKRKRAWFLFLWEPREILICTSPWGDFSYCTVICLVFQFRKPVHLVKEIEVFHREFAIGLGNHMKVFD